MKEINFRKIRNIDIDSFKYDICNSDFYKFDENTRLEEMVDTYDTVLKSILNKHAPIIKRKFIHATALHGLIIHSYNTNGKKCEQKSDTNNQFKGKLANI